MAKVAKETCCGPTVAPEYKPRLYLQLEGQDVSQIKSLKVGDQVELHVTGKIVGLLQRERPDHDKKDKVIKSGDIDLEGYRVMVMGDEENEFTQMADEDEEA